jgi:hypothetical protein
MLGSLGQAWRLPGNAKSEATSARHFGKKASSRRIMIGPAWRSSLLPVVGRCLSLCAANVGPALPAGKEGFGGVKRDWKFGALVT